MFPVFILLPFLVIYQIVLKRYTKGVLRETKTLFFYRDISRDEKIILLIFLVLYFYLSRVHTYVRGRATLCSIFIFQTDKAGKGLQGPLRNV